MNSIHGFLPARRYASVGLCDSDVSVCLCLSVCLYVRMSVTRRYFPAYSWVLAKRLLFGCLVGWLISRVCRVSVCPRRGPPGPSVCAVRSTSAVLRRRA